MRWIRNSPCFSFLIFYTCVVLVSFSLFLSIKHYIFRRKVKNRSANLTHTCAHRSWSTRMVVSMTKDHTVNAPDVALNGKQTTFSHCHGRTMNEVFCVPTPRKLLRQYIISVWNKERKFNLCKAISNFRLNWLLYLRVQILSGKNSSSYSYSASNEVMLYP